MIIYLNLSILKKQIFKLVMRILKILSINYFVKMNLLLIKKYQKYLIMILTFMMKIKILNLINILKKNVFNAFNFIIIKNKKLII